jgi:NTE family protein
MHKLFTRTILLLCLLAFSSGTIAQKSSGRPKIGLTLSGGGAKGLAHIGILQALDSAGLKIDYITGTSMGSIMGAMYAAGYSGDSIEKISRSIDWSKIFATAPDLDHISIEEKSEYDKYALEVPFEDGKFKIGKGIIEGQELWLKFSEVFQPVYNIHDFSKLPIPFKCIGTDLATGEAVEMDHGNIVTCIRASMAIPSVFTPVEYDGKLLVDGGVVDNFPVLNVKNMGADYVIGVSVSGGLLAADKLETALDILLQIGFFKDAENFDNHLEQCNMYITPDLKTYSTGSFEMADSIIDLGKITGALYYPIFKKMADSLNALYPSSPFVKNRLPKDVKINISQYSIAGLKNTTDKFFFGLLNLPKDQDYSHDEMSESIRRVYGSRYYKIIKYDFLPTDSGKTEMKFNVQEQYLTSIKFALNYSSFTKIGFKFNITSRDFLFKESRAMVSFVLSENPRLYAEYYKYINKNRTMRLNMNLYAEGVDFPVYDNFRLFETLRSNFIAAEFAIQHNLNRSSFVGISQRRVFSRIKTLETPSLIYNGNNNFWHTVLSYILNNVDDRHFPKHGWHVKTEIGYVYGQDPDFEVSYGDLAVNSDTLNFNYEAYARIYINANHFSPLSKKLTFTKNLTMGYLVTENPYIANMFLTGGVNEIIRNQIPFIGLDESEVKTGSITMAQLGLQYNLVGNIYLTGRYNAAVYNFHNRNSEEFSNEDNLLTGYGLTFGYNSPIGPIEATGMYCDQDGKLRTDFRLGFNF